MATKEMGLDKPVRNESGAVWTEKIRDNFDLIDAHDHTHGKGAPLSSAAIDVDDTLSLNDHALTDVESITFSDGSVQTTAGGGGGGAPSGAAGGDLGGTYPNPTVTNLTVVDDEWGSVYYRGETSLDRVPPGTVGQVLTTFGANQTPAWTTVSGTSGAGVYGFGAINVLDYEYLVVANDWAPAFAAAKNQAVSTGVNAVFVPAKTTRYTVKKPAPQTPSIDLRGLQNFRLFGEGAASRITMYGSGGGGSWSMIHISGDAENITIENLFLDGNYQHFGTELTNLDPGQHTHTLQIGGSNAGGYAKRVKVKNCVFTDMDGDGIALSALSGAFGAGDDISVVTIENCDFIDCHRSGISNQRAAEMVRIKNCLFRGTSDQDIDFEPSGTPGPRRYIIEGNYVIHGNDNASITLTGCGGADPSNQNIFRNNYVVGGTVGGYHISNMLFEGNYITTSGGAQQPLLKLRGTLNHNLIVNNYFERGTGTSTGVVVDLESTDSATGIASVSTSSDYLEVDGHGLDTGDVIQISAVAGSAPVPLAYATDYYIVWRTVHTFNLATTLANAVADTPTIIDITGAGTMVSGTITKHIYYPRNTDIVNNKIVTYVGSDGNNSVVMMTNGVNCSARGNDVRNYSGTTIPIGIKFEATSVMTASVGGWTVSDNRIIGDSAPGGKFTYGTSISPVGAAVSDIRVTDNHFQGCTNKILWNKGSGGSYVREPMAWGNTGFGNTFVSQSNITSSGVLIGGSPFGQAMYTCTARPTFSGTLGSTCINSAGVSGTLLFINHNNNTGWYPLG